MEREEKKTKKKYFSAQLILCRTQQHGHAILGSVIAYTAFSSTTNYVNLPEVLFHIHNSCPDILAAQSCVKWL